MRKSGIILTALCVAALAAPAAFAADSVVWFDIRDGVTPGSPGVPSQSILAPAAPFTVGQEASGTAVNAGQRGAGQVVRLNPKTFNGYESTFGTYPDFDGDGDASTADLWMYVDINDKTGGGDTLSSLGVDMDIAVRAGPIKNPLCTLDIEWETAVGWSGTRPDTSGGPASLTTTTNSLKAVAVPVSGGPPSYDVTVGPGIDDTMPVRVAKFTVTAGRRSCPAILPGGGDRSTYDVNLSVNNLLTTRVFNPATPGDGSAEQVAFGYDEGTGLPDELTSGSGSVVGSTTALADVVIQIRMKGDSNFDGTTNVLDLPGFFAANGPSVIVDQREKYLFEFNGDPLGFINALDLPTFFATFGPATPCVPGVCP